MNNQDKWAVTVDLTKMDLKVFEYARFVSSILRPTKIHFIHVVKEFKHLPFLPSEYVDGFQHQLVAEKHLEHENKVKEYFKDLPFETECLTVPGSPLDEVLNIVDSNSISLVIAGRKNKSTGAGIVSDRLSRHLSCNFLIVPEGFTPKLKNVLVTTDFSEHSTLALQKAVEMTQKDKSIQIMVHHSYRVPMGYSKVGKSFVEFAAIMKANAEKTMNRWLKPHQAKILLTLRNDESLLHQTMDIIRKHNIDLVVIGSKGQTSASLALLGSHTLKLLKGNDQVPMLIVKKKGENYDILNALRSL
jgi:nucleotide-binding universal stress UspA family protein